MSKAIVSGVDPGQLGAFADQLVTAEAAAAAARQGISHDRTSITLTKLREEAREQGRQQGYREGYEEGLLKGETEGREAVLMAHAQLLKDFADQLGSRAAELEDAIEAWFVAAEEQLAEVALLVAAKVISAEITANREIVVAIVRDALAEVDHVKNVRIRVNPADSEYLSDQTETILAANRSLRRVEVVPDSTIHGGCVVESDAGVIDATVSTRLEAIVQAFREAA